MVRTVAFPTLGCKVNQSESDSLAGLFRERGYQVVEPDAVADVYVINTCTVTHLGDRKSRQLIRRIVRNHPDALVVVAGCYAQVAPREIAEIPGVDLVVGTHGRSRIPELVETLIDKDKERPLNQVDEISCQTEFEELPVNSRSVRTRAFLKIQEGCNQYCTYCIVPYARGPLRSLPPDRVLAELQRLVQAGFKEIVLTGIHTCAYGLDLGTGFSLNRLLERIGREVPDLPRLRLSSIEPGRITEALVETIAKTPMCCPHFHIPLQSGDDGVLRRMGRPYTSEDYVRVIGLVRRQLPEAAITTDMIVGFPGETDQEFANSLALAETIGFSRIHVFKYSPRKGTPAAAYPDQVAPPVKEERSRRLMQLAAELAKKYSRRFIGKTVNVLVEEELQPAPAGGRAEAGEKWYRGLSSNYLDVAFPCRFPGITGEFVPVVVDSAAADRVTGRVSGRPQPGCSPHRADAREKKGLEQ